MRVVLGSQRSESGDGVAGEEGADGWIQEAADADGSLAGAGTVHRESYQPGILRPGIVHRLDKGTSGLIVVAKNGPTHAGLCEQFAVGGGLTS